MPVNFEFQPGDAKALAEMCLRLRKRAKNNPCVTQRESFDPKFGFLFSTWNLRLTVDAWTGVDKSWHASAACLEEVGTVPVQLTSGLIAEMPQDALVSVENWSKEMREQGEFLLGELLGPAIVDPHTRIEVTQGLWALHYVIKYTG